MSISKITRSENTYVNGKLYAVKVLYLSGVWRDYKAPCIPKTVVDYVRFWSPEMPDSAFDQSVFFNEYCCPYPDSYTYGGCPANCKYKRVCCWYDGEALR